VKPAEIAQWPGLAAAHRAGVGSGAWNRRGSVALARGVASGDGSLLARFLEEPPAGFRHAAANRSEMRASGRLSGLFA
jgi:hypothetical protein